MTRPSGALARTGRKGCARAHGASPAPTAGEEARSVATATMRSGALANRIDPLTLSDIQKKGGASLSLSLPPPPPPAPQKGWNNGSTWRLTRSSCCRLRRWATHPTATHTTITIAHVRVVLDPFGSCESETNSLLRLLTQSAMPPGALLPCPLFFFPSPRNTHPHTQMTGSLDDWLSPLAASLRVTSLRAASLRVASLRVTSLNATPLRAASSSRAREGRPSHDHGGGDATPAPARAAAPGQAADHAHVRHHFRGSRHSRVSGSDSASLAASSVTTGVGGDQLARKRTTSTSASSHRCEVRKLRVLQ